MDPVKREAVETTDLATGEKRQIEIEVPASVKLSSPFRCVDPATDPNYSYASARQDYMAFVRRIGDESR